MLSTAGLDGWMDADLIWKCKGLYASLPPRTVCEIIKEEIQTIAAH